MKTKKKKDGAVPAAAGASGFKVPPQTVMRLADLNFAPYNPRTISDEKMAALKASLVKHGLVLNMVVQAHSEQYGSSVLIGGHQRVRAMREVCAERGWPEPEAVPCTVLDVPDAEAKQLNVALNNIEGEFDPYKLGAMFRDIRGGMTMDDVLATGFQAVEIDQAIALVATPDDQALALEEGTGDLSGFGASITLSVEFTSAEERDAAKAALREAAEASGRKAGDIVGEAIRAMRSAGKLPRHKAGGGKDANDRRAGPRKKARAA
jgi:ParB-like chromosome segregation protein Spo0J